MDIGIWQTHDDHAGHGYDRIYGLLKKSDDETICPLYRKLNTEDITCGVDSQLANAISECTRNVKYWHQYRKTTELYNRYTEYRVNSLGNYGIELFVNVSS